MRWWNNILKLHTIYTMLTSPILLVFITKNPIDLLEKCKIKEYERRRGIIYLIVKRFFLENTLERAYFTNWSRKVTWIYYCTLPRIHNLISECRVQRPPFIITACLKMWVWVWCMQYLKGHSVSVQFYKGQGTMPPYRL